MKKRYHNITKVIKTKDPVVKVMETKDPVVKVMETESQTGPQKVELLQKVNEMDRLQESNIKLAQENRNLKEDFIHTKSSNMKLKLENQQLMTDIYNMRENNLRLMKDNQKYSSRLSNSDEEGREIFSLAQVIAITGACSLVTIVLMMLIL